MVAGVRAPVPITGEWGAAPTRTTYGGQPILRTVAQGAPALLRSLATRILPTVATRAAPALAAFGLAAQELKKSPWLLGPGGIRARRI
jgi:hypothetical protein